MVSELIDDDDDLTITDLGKLEKEARKLDGEIDEAMAGIVELWDKTKDHCHNSNYGHYTQLQVSLMDLSKAVNKFLGSSSKRPRGKIEFIFNNAIEYVGGGEFMAEHGGYEQTNCRVLDTLQNFGKIKDLCLAAIDESEEEYQHAEWESMFNKFDEVAKHTFNLLTYAKSQKRRSSDVFDDLLLEFLISWEKVFPNVKCFNKMEFLMQHVNEFIDEYGVYGRFSAESHESVHTRFDSINKAVKRMASTKKRSEKFFVRATVNLKEEIVKNKSICETKMSGKKRGKYNNVNVATKAMDDVDFVKCSVFKDDAVWVDGIEYLDIVVGGRIPAEYKQLYMYAKLGRAPDNWVECLDNCKFLSASKKEQAKQARH